MARWTKKLIAQQLQWTDECFKKALIDVHGEFMSEDEKEQDCYNMSMMIKLDWREETRTPDTNQRYLKHLCDLDTDKLSLILEAYKLGKQFRHATTMDVIMSELLESSVNPETRHKHES